MNIDYSLKEIGSGNAEKACITIAKVLQKAGFHVDEEIYNQLEPEEQMLFDPIILNIKHEDRGGD